MDKFGEWITTIGIGGVGAWTAVGLVLVAIIRQRPITQRLTNEREGNLLRERAFEMRRMRRRIAQLEAEQRVDRHTVANLIQCLDSLFLMIELNPEKAGEAASKVRQKWEKMKSDLAKEKAGLLASWVSTAEDDEIEETAERKGGE